MLFLRSLLFSIGMISSTLIFAPLALLTLPLPFKQRYGFIRNWAIFNLWWLKLTCNIRYEVSGMENITDQNAIIFCKHQSTWETLALQQIFPPLVWIMKRELLWVPLFGWGLAMLEPIAIKRGAGRKAVSQLLKQGLTRLNKGRWVVIFPEGTRIPAGESRKFKVGGALLAQKTGYPVVPVAHNAGTFWARKKFIKKPGTIQVCIGPAIDTENLSASEINTMAEQWINAKMAEIEG